MPMSSKYVTQNRPRKGRRTFCMRRAKTLGATFRPIGKTRQANWPTDGAQNAVFASSASLRVPLHRLSACSDSD